MGHKVNPTGFRLGISTQWTSNWYAEKAAYGENLNRDMAVRSFLTKKLAQANVSKIQIERPAKSARIIIHTARPGIVIGKKGEDIEKLKSDLADERLANEQLEERVKAIRDRQESQVSELQAQVAGFKASIGDLDAELQRLRHANDQLTANNAELREALEKNVSEPHLINRAMLAELEGLRAARSADRAETQTLIDTLEPLLAAAAQEESA